MSGPPKAPRRAFAEPKRALQQLRGAAGRLVPEGDYVQGFPAGHKLTRRVGAQALSTGRPSHRPGRNEHPVHRVARPSPQPGPLHEQLAPQSIPFASIVRCLVALVARRRPTASSAGTVGHRASFRDGTPPSRLRMLRPLVRGRGRTSVTAAARFRPRMTASVSVPALQTPALDELRERQCERAALLLPRERSTGLGDKSRLLLWTTDESQGPGTRILGANFGVISVAGGSRRAAGRLLWPRFRLVGGRRADSAGFWVRGVGAGGSRRLGGRPVRM